MLGWLLGSLSGDGGGRAVCPALALMGACRLANVNVCGLANSNEGVALLMLILMRRASLVLAVWGAGRVVAQQHLRLQPHVLGVSL